MSADALQVDAIWQVVAEVMERRHFVIADGLSLEWEHTPRETISWELFRGQLVPGNLTRETATFESWNVFAVDEAGRWGAPLLAVKLDHERGEVHVVRGLLCYAWEGYDAGGNVYLSREVQRWQRELVGTLRLKDFEDAARLREKLAALVFGAVIGSSRLPLTSVESPLPQWSLGRVGYFCDGLHRSLMVAARAPKVLEWLIRSSPADQLAAAVDQFLALQRDAEKSAPDTCRLVRAMVNEVSLSPYTDFVDKVLEFLRLLVDRTHLSAEQHVDFLAWLLRQLARHLTAYDLVTFHHRGANYPDALLLDAALKEYLRLAEAVPALFLGEDDPAQRRRRALRAGWLHRRRYEGHPVPDAPTSPGENMRVLPAPHVRVPDEQILNLGKRKKRLYSDDPLPVPTTAQGRETWQQCGRDLRRIEELRELGMAIFVERPLGNATAPGEPDSSPLLAHQAYSQSLAERAILELAREPLLGLTKEDVARCWADLAQPWPADGMLARDLTAQPGHVVQLADAAKAASDFVVLRTMVGSVRAFFARPDVARALKESGAEVDVTKNWLIIGQGTDGNNTTVLIRNGSERWDLRLRWT